MVFEQADAAREKHRVERTRGIGLQRMIGQPLQQQRHPHTALGGLDQGLAEAPARKEIGVGDDDLVARTADRLEVCVLDRVAVAQVVAHDEGRADFAHGLYVRRCEQRLQVAVAQARPRHQPPQTLRRGDDRL